MSHAARNQLLKLPTGNGRPVDAERQPVGGVGYHGLQIGMHRDHQLDAGLSLPNLQHAVADVLATEVYNIAFNVPCSFDMSWTCTSGSGFFAAAISGFLLGDFRGQLTHDNERLAAIGFYIQHVASV
jgi:hypothetical protein